MFWNKKDDATGLPDLPPIKSPFSKELMPDKEETVNQEPEELNDNQPLPTFPDSPSDKGFSQSAIKEAVSDGRDNNPYIAQNNQDNISSREESIKAEEISEDFTNEPINESYESSITQDIPVKPVEIKESPAIPKYEEKEESYLKPSLNLPIGLPPEEEKTSQVLIPERIIQKTAPIPAPKIQVERQITERVVQYQKPEPPSPKNADIYVKIDKFMSAKKSIIQIKDQVGQIDELLKKIRETKLREERELSIWEKEIFSIKEKIKDVNDNIFDRSQ